VPNFQAMLFSNGGHLLAHAESILNPEVFTHPVWIRFGRYEAPTLHQLINELLNAAKVLQNDDPDNACQVLLACVAYQSQIGQHEIAMKTLQQVQILAERNAFDRIVVWVKWGMSSISFQERKYEQTIRHLEGLEAILNQKEEWILADYIDTIKVSLQSPPTFLVKKNSKPQKGPPPEDLLNTTFDWLQHWGHSDGKAGPETSPEYYKSCDTAQKTKASQPFLFIQRWGNYWDNLLMSARNITNSHGTGNDKKSQTVIVPQALAQEKIFANREIVKSDSKHRRNRKSKHMPQGDSVIAQMLGAFNVTIQDTPIKLPASRGLSLMKYLILHHKHSTPRDVLMEVFWPESDPDSARNNLNVAMYNLRQILRSVTKSQIVCFEDGAYCLAPDLKIWLDVEEFEHCIREGQLLESKGQITAAATEYDIAVNLYRGDLLADTPYESWAVLDRERLRAAYFDALDRHSQIYFNQERYTTCINLCQLILARDACREDAHCRIMQCYSRLGQNPLALRQYQICVDALQTELEVDPSPETTHLFEKVRHHRHV
jgi:DNA-binding SARP family transcriptional activator